MRHWAQISGPRMLSQRAERMHINMQRGYMEISHPLCPGAKSSVKFVRGPKAYLFYLSLAVLNLQVLVILSGKLKVEPSPNDLRLDVIPTEKFLQWIHMEIDMKTLAPFSPFSFLLLLYLESSPWNNTFIYQNKSDWYQKTIYFY